METRDRTPRRSRPASFRQRLSLTRQYDSSGRVVYVKPTRADVYFSPVLKLTTQRRYCGLGLLLPMHSRRVEIRLPSSEFEALQTVAVHHGLTMSEMMRELVSSYLDALEKQYGAED